MKVVLLDLETGKVRGSVGFSILHPSGPPTGPTRVAQDHVLKGTLERDGATRGLGDCE